ncbi:hypothetical protein OAI33_15285 [Pirellulaceae bacterium]|nr:hypothetical protein [Pirellulaceae bacterium]
MVQIKATPQVSMQQQLKAFQPQNVQSQVPQEQPLVQSDVSQQQSSQLPSYTLPPAITGTPPQNEISKQVLKERDAQRVLKHAAQTNTRRQRLFTNEKSLSDRIIPIFAGSLILIILIVVIVIVVKKAGKGFNDMQEQVADSVGNIAENVAENGGLFSGKRTIELVNGTVEIEGKGGYGERCSLHYEGSDGLVLECDFKRGGSTDYGYDLSEPTVNRTMSKLAAFAIARGIIKNFLDGEYD